MRKIAVSLLKGGVGKTTTAINLISYLSQRGTVLAVDMDKTNFGLSKFSENLSDSPIEFRVTTPGRLPRLVESGKADFCVIDTPPMLEKPTLAALRVADVLVVPVVPETMVLDGLATLMEVVEFVKNPRIEGSNPKLEVVLLLSMTDRRHPETAEIEDEVRAAFPDLVWRDSVSDSKIIKSANNARCSLATYAPQSSVASVFHSLSHHVSHAKN